MTSDEFRYLWRALLTEHKLSNNITFSAVHNLLLPACLLTEPVSNFWQPPKTSLFLSVTGNSFSNFCTAYPLSRYNFFIKMRSYVSNRMFTNTAVTCENTSFPLHHKFRSTGIVTTHEAWWKIISAFRNWDCHDIACQIYEY